MTPEDEIWKPVVGFEKRFLVSNYGRVKRLEQWCDGLFVYDYRFVSLEFGRGDYFRVSLVSGKNSVRRPVHRVVMEAFIGPGNGLLVNHKDGNGLNNHVSNLEYCTHRENSLHSYQVLGQKSMKGSEHGHAKITEAQAIEIRTLRKCGATLKELSNRFKVCQGTISGICLHHTWKHTIKPDEIPLKPHTLMRGT